MKKFLLGLAFLFVGVSARAETPVFDVGYSTFASVGVTVTSGTAVRINATRPTGFTANIGYYRLTNANPAWDIYIGDINVSTDTVGSGAIGHVLKANGGTVTWPVAKDYGNGARIVPIYAKGSDSAAVDRLPRLSVTWFGY